MNEYYSPNINFIGSKKLFYMCLLFILIKENEDQITYIGLVELIQNIEKVEDLPLFTIQESTEQSEYSALLSNKETPKEEKEILLQERNVYQVAGASYPLNGQSEVHPNNQEKEHEIYNQETDNQGNQREVTAESHLRHMTSIANQASDPSYGNGSGNQAHSKSIFVNPQMKNLLSSIPVNPTKSKMSVFSPEHAFLIQRSNSGGINPHMTFQPRAGDKPDSQSHPIQQAHLDSMNQNQVYDANYNQNPDNLHQQEYGLIKNHELQENPYQSSQINHQNDLKASTLSHNVYHATKNPNQEDRKSVV